MVWIRLLSKSIYQMRLDIAYAINVISQFTHSLKEAHLQAIHKILWCLKSTPWKGILFKKNEELSLETYTDVDQTGSIVDCRLISGCCTILRGNLVTWRSKKQDVVVRSKVKAKFRAMVSKESMNYFSWK